jgi:predicted metal-dependent hydrolase
MLADGTLCLDWLDGAEPDMHTLWSWHAAEETEHKSVAIDVYRAAGGGNLRRV